MVVELLRRLAAIGRALFHAHMVVAEQEAGRDASRIIMGVLLLSGAAVLVATTWLLLQFAALISLADSGMSWPLATLTLATANFVLAVFSGLIARSALSKPVLPETRALLASTIDTLIGPG